MNIRTTAVIFDMDGVITNTMPDHFHAWQKVLADRGIRVTHHDIYSREGQRGIDSVREIFSEYKKLFDQKSAQDILKEKEELFKKIVRIRFIPGMRSYLKFLCRSGFTLALVTGTSRHELHRILPDPLYDLFSVVVTGSDVRNGKPHPEPYLKALRQLKIRAADAVVFENAPFGIESAKKAGLRCFALETSLPRKYLKEADQVFHSVQDIRNRLKLIKK